ncbi:protein arginine N-methyltransferase 1-like isoform X2 [Oscarella lobularis]|uniref:protein arginine N-methyltransferase 1-like isoform X2 n=1 Tax=Oscarella lobularis TaxID=121494 RepID=UPI0033137661
MALCVEEDPSSDWDDVEEEEEEEEPCQDLFSCKMFRNVEDMLENCKAVHKFDLNGFFKAKGLDFYGRIKLINFIRKLSPRPIDVTDAVTPYPWDDDTYLKPVLAPDPLLHWDCGSDTEEEEEDKDAPDLVDEKSTNDVRAVEEELVEARCQLDRMKHFVQELVTENSRKPTEPHVDDDDSYFESYSHFGIHREMLQDKVRTEAYRDFMTLNKALFQDKIVLDVGCGTGILSMIAAQCGAKKVIGVDNSDILYSAIEIVRENKLEETVDLIKGKIEEVELPIDQVDIIISEWMGYFLLFESMLDSVLFARDKWLSPGGKVFPDKCSLHLVAINDDQLWKNHIGYWDDVYGYKMSCMKKAAITEALIDVVNSDTVMTDSCIVKEIDICKVSGQELDFEADFQLQVVKEGMCTGLVGYFEAEFNGDVKIAFSCSPSHSPTHWKQTVFLLPKRMQLFKGKIIEGRLGCKRNLAYRRSLDIQLNFVGLPGYTIKYCIA